MRIWTRLAVLLVLGSLLAGLPGVVVALDGSPVDLRRVEDPLFGIATVVPQDWQSIGGGTYTRGTPPQDMALIAVQSAQARPDQLWPLLLPQFALDEVPTVTGHDRGGGFDWTLYRFDIPSEEVALAVELALAQDGASTHLILLHAAADEFEALRTQVLLPAIEAFEVLAPEVTPDPATLGYAIEEVSFPGGDAGFELAGTLTLPKAPGPHPAIVLMSGSGPQDRDESLRPAALIKPFALIADALTSAGVAVLRYDDRGVGGSGGDYASATITDLASDGAAALDYLRGRPDIDPVRVGLLGHSEGGLYAAQLAAADPRVAFVVAMAAPATDGVTLMVAQNEAIARSQGASDEQVAMARDVAARSLPAARDGDEVALEATLREYFGGLWDDTPAGDRAVLGEREAFIDRQLGGALEQYRSDWFRSLLAYDPGPDWQRVGVPVLGLYGGKDVQVVSAQNEPALRSHLQAAGNEDVEIVVFDDANHLFQASQSGAVGEYGTLAAEFTPDFLPTLVEWVTARAGVVSPEG
jgi:pimeloyl-ACP methyl ester carboxylesterase